MPPPRSPSTASSLTWSTRVTPPPTSASAARSCRERSLRTPFRCAVATPPPSRLARSHRCAGGGRSGPPGTHNNIRAARRAGGRAARARAVGTAAVPVIQNRRTRAAPAAAAPRGGCRPHLRGGPAGVAAAVPGAAAVSRDCNSVLRGGDIPRPRGKCHPLLSRVHSRGYVSPHAPRSRWTLCCPPRRTRGYPAASWSSCRWACRRHVRARERARARAAVVCGHAARAQCTHATKRRRRTRSS